MPTRKQTRALAHALFDEGRYPNGLGSETAWLGIYQVLMWYEEVGFAGFERLPHIIDADKLRPSRRKRMSTSSQRPAVWQRRAKAVEDLLARELAVESAQVPDCVDRLMKSEPFRGLQRQNPLGIAFGMLVEHVLSRFGSTGIRYRLEAPAGEVFPGISMPGRSTSPSIDLLVLKDSAPRCFISCKWSLRHDRINDITNECPIYKAAAMRSRTELSYFLVTNEYDPARLAKVLDDTCVDGVVHVSKRAVVETCGLNDRLNDMLDLSEFIELTAQW